MGKKTATYPKNNRKFGGKWPKLSHFSIFYPQIVLFLPPFKAYRNHFTVKTQHFRRFEWAACVRNCGRKQDSVFPSCGGGGEKTESVARMLTSFLSQQFHLGRHSSVHLQLVGPLVMATEERPWQLFHSLPHSPGWFVGNSPLSRGIPSAIPCRW